MEFLMKIEKGQKMENIAKGTILFYEKTFLIVTEKTALYCNLQYNELRYSDQWVVGHDFNGLTKGEFCYKVSSEGE